VFTVLFKGTIVGPASGSLAGITASHNAGGQYFRRRAIPVNSNTLFQQNIRASMAQLSTRWVTTLTSVQRDSWNAYAAAVGFVNPLGDTVFISGLAMYVKVNTPRIAFGAARIDTAPTILTLTPLTAPTFTVVAATSTASVTFTNSDPWATAVGGFLFAFFSQGQNVTINYFKGPYRFGNKIAGAVVPPTSPATMTVPFALTAGQRCFARFVAIDSTGRPSVEVRTVATAS
jgi:hypothetical protein